MRGPTGTVLFRVALVAIALTGASCSDDPPKAGSLPNDSPSTASSSSSPTPATPEEQVEAAVRAYYAELTRAAQTNDTSKLKNMMSTGCPCYRAVRVIERNDREGERTPDATFELTDLRVHDVDGSTALAEVRTAQPAYRVLDQTGGVVDRVSAQETHLDLSLVRGEGEDWIIGNWFNLGDA